MTPDGKAELKITFSEERLSEIRKKYETTGLVDKEILDLLLKEAREALAISNQIGEENNKKIKNRLRKLNIRQIDMIKTLENEETTTEADRNTYRSYRQECENMME